LWIGVRPIMSTAPGRRPSFLDTSLRLDGIIEIVTLSTQSMYFSEFRLASKIKFKKSFLKYLRYCVEKNFVNKSQIHYKDLPDRYRGRKLAAKFYTFYLITAKGQKFLELVA